MRTAYFSIGPTFLHVSSYSKPTYLHGSLNPQEYCLIEDEEHEIFGGPRTIKSPGILLDL